MFMRVGFAYAESTRVITHPGLKGTVVDGEMLRAVFTMRLRQWPDGTPIRVFVLPDDSELHVNFVRERLSTYPYVLRSVWDRLVFTGTGFAPTLVQSEQEMRERVQNTAGAIGYVGRAGSNDARPVRVVPADEDSPR
jgi:ABC-type phosphate transport system substrate-binding protein